MVRKQMTNKAKQEDAHGSQNKLGLQPQRSVLYKSAHHDSSVSPVSNQMSSAHREPSWPRNGLQVQAGMVLAGWLPASTHVIQVAAGLRGSFWNWRPLATGTRCGCVLHPLPDPPAPASPVQAFPCTVKQPICEVQQKYYTHGNQLKL